MKDKEKKRLIVLIAILVLVDQVIKIVIYNSKIQIINSNGWGIGVLNNTKSVNNIAYILVSVVAIIMLVRYISSNNSYIKMNSRVILSFAIAGAISNSIDRIWNGGTVNYINIPNFSPLNLAYIYFIFTWIGMAFILTLFTRDRIKEKKESK